MSWAELATAFHLAPATDVLQAGRFERYQAWRDRVRWLQPDEPPLCVLFVSHRWDTPTDPDPSRRQFRAVSRFIDLVVRCTRACLLPSAERGEYLPPVRTEG